MMAEQKRRGRPPKTSAPAEETRGQQVVDRVEKRPPRVRMGAGGAFKLSPEVQADLDAKGLVARWALDDDQGKMEQYKAAYWDIYTDADGKQLTRPAKNKFQHVLIVLPRKYFEEDMALQRQQNNANLQKEAKLERGDGYQDYIPEGHEMVVSSDL